LPALEALHKPWTKRAERIKYFDFVPALNAGLAKIVEYYDRTADSDAYTFAMCSITSLCPLKNSDPSLVLDPSQKTEHIRKYWGQGKLESILKEAEETISVWNSSVPACAHNITVQTTLPLNVQQRFDTGASTANRKIGNAQGWRTNP
jgi:hypothetical protein